MAQLFKVKLFFIEKISVEIAGVLVRFCRRLSGFF
jgi:hypothetical protein